MTPITLKPREINILVECGKVLLIRPLPPEHQPSDGFRLQTNADESIAICMARLHDGSIAMDCNYPLLCPFGPPGTVLNIDRADGRLTYGLYDYVVRSVAIHRLRSITVSEAHAAGFHDQKSAIHMIDYEYDGLGMNPWCWFVMVGRDKGGKDQ